MSRKAGLLRPIFPKYPYANNFSDRPARRRAFLATWGRWHHLILTAISAGTLLLGFAAGVWASSDTLQLAVIGPLSGKDHAAGQAMLDGVQLCVAQVNQQGGIDGKYLEVLTYDDQNSEDIARQKALEIARNSNALAVIGHYYSSTSVEGGKVYKQHGLPAVTANATAPAVTESNPWYFRVTPNTNLQGKLAAIYLTKILKQNRVNIVYERDTYGNALQAAFTRSAGDLGLQVENVWGIHSKRDDVDQLLRQITRQLQIDPHPGALFVALQDHEAAEMIRLIREADIDLMIVGGDAIGSESFAQNFKTPALAKPGAGYYTDGIYAATFFIRDIGNYKAQKFSLAFKQRYGRAPIDTVAINYDAAAMAIEAIKRATIEDDLARSRANIRDQLATFADLETAYKGVTGRIYFDESGNAIKSLPFGIYSHGRLISAPTQLSPIINPATRVEYQKDLHKGRMITIDDRLMYKTTVVYTGIDVTEINNIDTLKGTFSADFYLWFRHSGALDYNHIEIQNATEKITLDDALMEMTSDDGAYRAYRIKADFKAGFTFRDYPFDAQTLSIRLRHNKLNSERLLFVGDDIGMQRNGGKTSVACLREHATLDPAGEWHLSDVLVFTDMSTTSSTLGNPDMFHASADTDISHSRFNVIIKIDRKAKSYVLKNLIPLFIIILLGYVMLFITPQGPPFVARMNLGVTALLSAIFLSMKAASQLPNIGYLVALDYIYFTTYALILSSIAITIAELMAIRRKSDLLAKRLELIGRVMQPFLFFSAIGIFVYLYA